jgi:hypothetical protein
MSKFRKAVMAAVVAGVGALGTALVNGSKLDVGSLGAAAAVAVAAGLAVYGIRNAA